VTVALTQRVRRASERSSLAPSRTGSVYPKIEVTIQIHLPFLVSVAGGGAHASERFRARRRGLKMASLLLARPPVAK